MLEDFVVQLFPLICKTEISVGRLREAGSVQIDGRSLDIAAVVAIARHQCIPVIEQSATTNGLLESTKAIEDSLQNGAIIYGVNTGFGGSADVRTGNRPALEKALMQTLQSAVLLDADKVGTDAHLSDILPQSMPLPWVKAMMAGISRSAIDAVISLLEQRITPIIPLRGSISASGDLMPLSYVAGTIEGSQDIYAHVESGNMSNRRTAGTALKSCGLTPLMLGPRDGLAIVNGTAASAAVASLVFSDAAQLTMLSLCLTALTAEAMAARIEWLHPFVSDIRPHPGQIEASAILRTFLKRSKLVDGYPELTNATQNLVERFDGALAQDRYPLRTSPQWIGPQLEDLLLAHSQIAIELNSTSDNPVTDPQNGKVYCGGNFQATAITSAVEKIRLGLQMTGKMIFSQCTEMINHHMSHGLPSNLAADDPSASFGLKGLDINMAAYQAELAFLANPVSSHVQSAEMHNQAINSLALLSVRYTAHAVELVGLMIASAFYASCQAVDLRVMHATFLRNTSILIQDVCTAELRSMESETLNRAVAVAGRSMRKCWWSTASLDATDRCDRAAWAFLHALSGLDPQTDMPSSVVVSLSVEEIRSIQARIKAELLASYLTHRTSFMQKPATAEFLGAGTGHVYTFIRHELGVPMHHGLIDHPGPEQGHENGGGKKTIGSQVSVIYKAVRDGRLFGAMSKAAEELGLVGK